MKGIKIIHLTKEYLLDQFLCVKPEDMSKYKIIECEIENLGISITLKEESNENGK